MFIGRRRRSAGGEAVRFAHCLSRNITPLPSVELLGGTPAHCGPPFPPMGARRETVGACAVRALAGRSTRVRLVLAAGSRSAHGGEHGAGRPYPRGGLRCAQARRGLQGGTDPEAEEIVQQLIENSTTFRDKTEFAQDKYIKKKKKKYEAVITIVKPSTRILSTMYYAREPGKINHLRYDTLAQMLTLGNIRAGNKMIVMETCAGLVLGAVMERMGGYGSIIQMYPQGGPVRAATSCFGFPASFFNSLYEFPLSKVDSLLSRTFSIETLPSESEDNIPAEEESNGSLDEKPASIQETEEESTTEATMEGNQTEEQETMDLAAEDTENKESKEKGNKENIREKQRKQQERRKKLVEAAALLKEKNADGLIVAGRFHPTPLLLSLLEFVAPSRPFVVYCQYREPLLECYTKLREKGGVINLKLSETWLRNYQVLPDRSHPKLTMSGGGGYLLSGITVVMDKGKSDAGRLEAQKTEEPTSKKRKLEELHS
uniref:tRNA (adenine(58)-N(1))-methyltransferase non-catalytic subunit TRM6 n=2 Tax=Crocodylus porosus TaxID=8502 RepID=A0A7M4EYT1_CROPO